ncbi:FadR/GntR family transcriptional regulator, partial [Salipiger sp. PrR003]|uniref:FadR/GntR family transcriptional regulator n=1 Tax=Salipiger sp. PrR003 TaxID=2706776 RepID=UPI00194597AF
LHQSHSVVGHRHLRLRFQVSQPKPTSKIDDDRQPRDHRRSRLPTPRRGALSADLARRGRSARTRPESEQLDAAFHRGIAEVTGNPILLGLLDYLAGVRRHAAWQREWELTYRKLGVSEFTQRHTAQHEAIAAAISLRDPDRAAAAMQAHLDTISTAMRGAGLPGLGAKGWAPRT